MAFSHDMPDIPAYHSPGRRIYCMKEFPPEQLREEHIIPLALGGTWRIEHAACFPCKNDTNRLYENAALNFSGPFGPVKADQLVCRVGRQVRPKISRGSVGASMDRR